MYNEHTHTLDIQFRAKEQINAEDPDLLNPVPDTDPAFQVLGYQQQALLT
jgi:hypothetical protein